MIEGWMPSVGWSSASRRGRVTSARTIARCCSPEGCKQGACAAVIACGDASPVLEAGEHGLNAMALAIEHRVVRDGVVAGAR
jgi:hypothetical protein